MKFELYDKEKGLGNQLKESFWKIVIAFLVTLGFVVLGAVV